MNNTLDKKYTDLLQDILDNGTKKQTRNGEVLSVFGRQIRHKMSEGFPLLTTKKMYFKGIVTELLWFLRGDTNIKYLVDNDCHIWDGDAYKNYEKWFWNNIPPKADISGKLTKEEFIRLIKTDDEFAEKWGELGPIYGKQWRKWGGKLVPKRLEDEGKIPVTQYVMEGQLDQIAILINELKTNPDSRRLMVNAWAVHDLPKMMLPPCHYGFQIYTRELSLEERAEWLQNSKGYDLLVGNLEHDHIRDVVETEAPTRAISLMWNQRSVDTPLGLPFNIASYGLLLEILAKAVNMVPDELIGNLGDCHIYTNQIDGVKEQIGRPYTLEERVVLIPEGSVSQALFDSFKSTKRACTEILAALAKYRISPALRTREPFELPKLKMNPIFLANLEHKGLDEAINGQVNFELENYQSHPTIKMPLSN